MDYTTNSSFSRALMTGLAIGIAATILCLLYNLFYRYDATSEFVSSDFVNVSSTIFGVNIIFVVFGLILAAVVRAGRVAEIVYALVFVVLTIVGVVAALHVHPSIYADQNQRFHGLLAGMIIIVGAGAALLPFFYHNKGFKQHVL